MSSHPSRAVLGIALALIPAIAFADPADRWRSYIEEASVRFDVPSSWIERVIEAESGRRTTLRGWPITSRAGAMGLMQLMPGTWSDMRSRLGLGRDPYNPRDNILAGTFYLRLMHDQFGYPALFAAYNAGPSRYRDYLEGRRSLPNETRLYVGAVTRSRAPALTRMVARTPAQPIFFGAQEAGNQSSASDGGPSSSLFVIRR